MCQEKIIYGSHLVNIANGKYYECYYYYYYYYYYKC